VYQRATSGVTQNEILDKDARIKYPMDWSRDGRYIVEEVQDPKTGADIWLLPLFGDRKAFPYLHSEFNESFAKLSPNGQWLAYVSDESKRNEVYVRTFPNPGGKWQVSTNGAARRGLHHVGARRGSCFSASARLRRPRRGHRAHAHDTSRSP